MRKGDDREKKRGKKRMGEKNRGKKIIIIMMKIVATNVVASRPPNGDRLQHRPLVPKLLLQKDRKMVVFELF